jgi:hypothetical protein
VVRIEYQMLSIVGVWVYEIENGMEVAVWFADEASRLIAW